MSIWVIAAIVMLSVICFIGFLEWRHKRKFEKEFDPHNYIREMYELMKRRKID